MKRIIIIAVLVVIVILVAIVVIFSYDKMFKKVSVSSFKECLSAGYIILESYPRQCQTPDGRSFVENIGNALTKTDLINLTNPLPNQIIKSPLVVTGEARGGWYFEASFPVKLYDESNNLIAQTIAQAQGDWMTEDFVPFKAVLNFDILTSTNGTLVLEKDNPSGLPANGDELKVPLVFDKKMEIIKVKAYFNNSKLDPEISCSKVFPVEREVSKISDVARAALDELFQGVTEVEKTAGFFTSLNTGVKIQSLTIENRVAKVDFDEKLESAVGGSCRIAAIRAQITQTLKQFSTVDEVIISINGRTEDILQP